VELPAFYAKVAFGAVYAPRVLDYLTDPTEASIVKDFENFGLFEALTCSDPWVNKA